MPTSRGPQALQAPSVLLLWIAPSLFLAYTARLSRTQPPRGFANPWAPCRAHPEPVCCHHDHYLRPILGINKSPTSNGLRSARLAADRDKLKLFAVRHAGYRTFGIVGDTGAPNQSLW